MSLRESINYLKEHPEYNYVLIIPGKYTTFYDFYRTKKEATHDKREYHPNGTVMHKDKFILSALRRIACCFEKHKGA